MIRSTIHRIVPLATALLVVFATPVAARQWSERTILSFSHPVRVPGATLPPGTYAFTLVDPDSSQHVVKIMNEEGSTLFALTHAMPVKRAEPAEDVVLMFDPSETSATPVVKGWFTPGRLYGHEFLYPEEEAQDIADRTRTIVLSRDIPDTSAELGTITVIRPEGGRSVWTPDPITQREWATWRSHANTADNAQHETEDDEEIQESSAPMIVSTPTGTQVDIDTLEDESSRYIGRTVTVDAEVQDVLGPRLFSIDEPNWADLRGELLVMVPAGLVALVQDDDRITVTGTVRPFVTAEVTRGADWLVLDEDIEVDLGRKPVIVASRIVGGNNDTALVMDVTPETPEKAKPMAAPAITNLSTLALGGEALVGRRVEGRATVESLATHHGFFVRAGGTRLFVMPESMPNATVAVGSQVHITGLVLEMPRPLAERLADTNGFNDRIYVYATSLKK